MTGTIRNPSSRLSSTSVNYEKTTKRPRVVHRDCDDWSHGPSLGRRSIRYKQRPHQPRESQHQPTTIRWADSSRKRSDQRRRRRFERTSKIRVEDTLSIDESIIEDEQCFLGRKDRYLELEREFLTNLEAIEDYTYFWNLDERLYLDVELDRQRLQRMKEFYKV